LNLYSPNFPIYTHARFLPGTKVNRCQVEQSILCEGSIISESSITHSIVGIRATVGAGSVLDRTVLMGARFYESQSPTSHPVPLGVGEDCEIRNAIVDLNARIGAGSKLVNAKGLQEYDGENYCIRGGVIVVPRDSVIAPGTVV
jgi:glucose-1-phosphate adenylyltransferase